MKKQIIVLAVSVGALLVAGCHKNDTTGPVDQPPNGVTTEVQAMQYYAAQDPFVANDEQTIADNSIETMNYGTFGKVDAAVTPLRWGRFITGVNKTISTNVLPGDTVAVVTVNRIITGTLKVEARTGAGDTVILQKPFTDQSDRNIIFRRVASRRDSFWVNWIPVASSLVRGGTQAPNNTINITQVQLFVANGDTITVTDPTSYYLRYIWLKLWYGGRKDVPTFISGQALKLQVTVNSAATDTDLVALRYGFNLLQHRRVMLNLVSETKNADGTYTRVFETSRTAPPYMHFFRGSFNIAIDAVTHATLFDDTAPYSVSWWGIPYRVL